MKKTILAAALAAAALPAFAADVGVSVTVGQPGFYGQINIGDFPQPRLVYAQPVIVRRAPDYDGGPIYLHVPPGHEKHWSKHCAQYDACGRPVYFVRDDWYNREYVPHYQHRDDDHGDHDGRGDGDHGHDNGHGRGHDNGHGHGHDNGHGDH